MASDVLDAGQGPNVRGVGGGDGQYGTVGLELDRQEIPKPQARARQEDETPANQHQPLSGVVLCCTAIPTETRSALAEAAAPLGATHSLDLTAAVTHLLVGHWDTAKYAFVARARPDVRVLQPSFIEAVREQWIAGVDDVDVPALEQAHVYPPLQGALVCVTGLGDAEERRMIEARVNAAGGNYTGDLTRDVTHLIAARPEGAKYSHARQWKIHVTVLQWLWDSLERGMLLDASYYDPLLPEDRIGRGAFVQPSAVPTQLVKRKNSDAAAPARKLRRTASAKFSSQNEHIWGDIVGAGLTNLNPEKQDAWKEHGVADSFRSSRTRDSGPQRTVSEGAIQSRPQNNLAETATRRTDGLFSGTNVFVHGFGGRETAVLERHLRTHAATLFDDASKFAEAYTSSPSHSTASPGHLPFLILTPHSSYPATLPPALDQLDPRPPLATDFYFEAAIHARKRLPTGTSPLHLPLPSAIPGFADLTLCATGFADAELLHLAKAIAQFGASYSGTLRRDASALVCREPEGSSTEQQRLLRDMEGRDKVRFARIHGVPVVRAGWLWKCARQGRKVSWVGWEMESGSRSDKGAIDAETHAKAGPVEPAKPSHPPHQHTEAPTKVLHDPKPPAAAVAVADTTPTSPLKPRDAPMAAKETPLAAALSTLLAQRSRSATHSFSTEAGAANGTLLGARDEDGSSIGARRRRTLLGRAASGASLRSVGSANTDGVGTPVEGPAGGMALGMDGANSSSTHVGAGSGSERMDVDVDLNPDHAEHSPPSEHDNDLPDPPQLTQVGYIDVPAKEWRKQMEARMGGGGSEAGESGGVGSEAEEPPEGDGVQPQIGAGAREGGGNQRRSLRIRDEVRPDDDREKEALLNDGEARRVLRRRG